MSILKLAWRNLLRNKRRALISMSAIGFAIMMTSLSMAIIEGIFGGAIDYSLKQFTSYIQIQDSAFAESPSIRKVIKLEDSAIEQIRGVDHYISSSPRILGTGLIGTSEKSLGAGILGIDPISESKTTSLHERLNAGVWVNDKNIYDIVVGYKMLNNLRANIGDTMVILTNSYDGSMGNLKFRIAGTIKMGNDEFDKRTCIIHIDAADELFGLYGNYQVYAIALKNIEAIAIAKPQVEKALSDYGNAKVLGWEDLLPELNEMMRMKKVSAGIMIGIIVIVVMFGIFNTITMSVTERFNEFGIMLAIGIEKSLLLASVFWETVILAILGIILGLVPGYGISWYLTNYPIQLTGEAADMMATVGIEPIYRSSTEPMIFIISAMIIFCCVLLVFILPGIKILKLKALKGIRYT